MTLIKAIALVFFLPLAAFGGEEFKPEKYNYVQAGFYTTDMISVDRGIRVLGSKALEHNFFVEGEYKKSYGESGALPTYREWWLTSLIVNLGYVKPISNESEVVVRVGYERMSIDRWRNGAYHNSGDDNNYKASLMLMKESDNGMEIGVGLELYKYDGVSEIGKYGMFAATKKINSTYSLGMELTTTSNYGSYNSGTFFVRRYF